MKYSLVFPCKDEEKAIKICITKAKSAFKKENISDYEIIVVDNNSSDKSVKIAKTLGVKIISEKTQGYGAALKRGFEESKGEYVLMCDADNTYDLRELQKFLKFKNKDVVIGNRFNKKMEKGAMTFMHKFVGNPLFSSISKLFFRIPCSDTHCGFRMIKKDSLKKLDLQSSGMEIASEMLIKAQKNNMSIKEVDITYSKRIGDSKLRSFNDGWRHLKMILLYSPKHLFFIPGLLLFLVGFILMIFLQLDLLNISGNVLNAILLLIGSISIILGFQLVLLWIYAKTYTIIQLKEKDVIVEYIHNNISLEKTIGAGFFLIGISILALIVALPNNSVNFQGSLLNLGIIVLTIIVLGIQTIASGFMLSILGNKR